MIKEFERSLTSNEKKALSRRIQKVKVNLPKQIGGNILRILIIIVFGVVLVEFPKIYLIIPAAVITFFTIWYLYYEILDLLRTPKFFRRIRNVIENGIVLVTEINIDRYIRIDNFEDEGNHFIIEYDGQLSLIGGQDFLGIRKLKNKIEKIEIVDSARTHILYEKIKKHGSNLNPFYTFKKGLSDKFTTSIIWDRLTDRDPFKGKLEDLNHYIELDKKE